MSFDLTALTLEQCTHFASRLATHLQPTQSRQRLMAVREAFARTAGYPDAHALEQAIKRARQAIPSPTLRDGAPQGSTLPTFGLALQWATVAWKRHRDLLAVEPFELAHAQALLAATWGHAAWAEVEISMALQKKPSASFFSRKTAAALMLGTTDEGPLGLTDKAWAGHVLAVDAHLSRRKGMALEWARQRAGMGDEVVVFDGTPGDGDWSALLAGEDIDAGLRDWREGIDALPGLEALPSTAVIELVIEGIRPLEPQPNSPAGELQFTPSEVITQAQAVARQFMALARRQRTLERLTQTILDSTDLDWIRKNAWLEMIGTTPLRHPQPKAMVEVIRLPWALGEEDLSPGQHRRILMASALAKGELLRKIDGESDRGPAAMVMWLDVPLWARSPGWAVVYAQARSLRTTLVECGPREIIWRKEDGKEQMSAVAGASVANLNTKVFGRVDDEDPGVGRTRWDRGNVTAAEPQRKAPAIVHPMNVIAGSELVGFWPIGDKSLAQPAHPRP